MADYDKRRALPGRTLSAMTKRALEQFLSCLGARNAEGIERLLAEDVVSISDGGGEVAAAMRQVRGRSRVMRLVMGLAQKTGIIRKTSFVSLNGLPALLVELETDRPNIASRLTMHVEVGRDGRIRRLLTVLAPSKLTAI